MKRMVNTFLAIITVVVGILSPQVAYADPPGSMITIEGTVTNNGRPATGIWVAIRCAGKLIESSSDRSYITGSDGTYIVHPSIAFCPKGSTVEVRADKDGDNVFESGAVGVAKTITTINVELGAYTTVPEFGWLGGALATGAGILVITYARRYSGHNTST